MSKGMATEPMVSGGGGLSGKHGRGAKLPDIQIDGAMTRITVNITKAFLNLIIPVS